MSRPESPLKFGIPKGSLEQSTVELFAKAGWRIQTSGRSYFPTIDDPSIRCSLMRPQEMSRYIESGFLDGGVTGEDWICLLYTSPSPRDATLSRMPSSA